MAVDGMHHTFQKQYDLTTLRRGRTASQCVCCGGESLVASAAILMPFVADRIFGWKPVVIDESWGLRTIASGTAYALCNTLKCSNCGHLFCDIRFSDSEMAALYDQYREEEYTRLRDHYEPGYANRNAALNVPITYTAEIEKFLAPYIQRPLTILDWGGDTGINTPFKDDNVAFDVYDISNKDVVDGARVVTRDEALSSRYRLIICSMVLEHVPFPSDVLLEAKQAMDAESILYIEVPFEDVMRAERAGDNAAKRHWHEHINFYSETSMSRLLQNCGLTEVARNILVTKVAGSDVHIFQVACKLSD